MKVLRFKKGTIEEKITIVLALTLFIGNAIICVFPAIWSFMNALKTGPEFFADSLALPQNWLFSNFITVFDNFIIREFNYLDMLINSLWILVVKVFLSVLSSALLAYALAKFRFPGSNFLYWLVIFAKTIPLIGSGAAGMKLMRDLNMINNPSTIWIAWAGGFDFAFIVFYGTFKGISPTYSEAARLDGANNFVILFKVILPQAIASIIAIAITEAISVWNDYSTPMLYLRDYPNLAYGLYLFDIEANYVENSKPTFFAAALISCIPVIILYAANMKLIMENVTAGGLKG